MLGVFFAPFAELLKLDLFCVGLFILAGKIIDPLARPALHFDEIILRHINNY